MLTTKHDDLMRNHKMLMNEHQKEIQDRKKWEKLATQADFDAKRDAEHMAKEGDIYEAALATLKIKYDEVNSELQQTEQKIKEAKENLEGEQEYKENVYKSLEKNKELIRSLQKENQELCEPTTKLESEFDPTGA